MKLVSDWKQAWKWSSMHAMGAAVAVQGGWAMLSDDLKAHVPAALASGITIALLALGVIGRLRDQTSKHATDDTDQAGA